MAQSGYAVRLRRAKVLGFVGMAAMGIAVAVIAQMGRGGENFWIVLLALLLVSGVGCLTILPWWRRLDDRQREGHYFSWYWGGSLGGLVALLAMIAATTVDSELVRGGTLVLIGQAVAFFIGSVVWSWRHRGEAA